VAYLRHGRPPQTTGRSVFVRARAPYVALDRRSVGTLVARAAARAGLGVVHAHRLRHTVASAVLAAFAPLPEVGQLLRHRSTASVNGITYSASATENNLGGRVLLGIQKAGACYGRENTQEGCFTSPTSTAGCTITTMPYQLVTTGTARWWLHNPIGQYYYNDGGAPYNP